MEIERRTPEGEEGQPCEGSPGDVSSADRAPRSDPRQANPLEADPLEADPREADPRPAVPGGSDPLGADAPAALPDFAAAEAPAGEDPASTQARVAAGLTAPRAVLRAVPDGFPTPPPRPAVPNRRPALPPSPAPAAGPSKRLLLAGIVVVAVLALALALGGVLLAVRHLGDRGSDAADPSAPTATAASEDSAGAVTVQGVEVAEVSTEVGVRVLGSGSSPLRPEGEFVLVTFTVANGSTSPLTVLDGAMLDAGSAEVAADVQATSAHRHSDDTQPAFVLAPGDTSEYTVVFDVPVGTAPTALRLAPPELDEPITLPLSS